MPRWIPCTPRWAQRAGLRSRLAQQAPWEAKRCDSALSSLPPRLPPPPPPQALYRLSAASRAMLQGCTEEMCETSWSPRGMHWDQQSDSKPPLVADSLCKEDEQVLGERDGEEARAAA